MDKNRFFQKRFIAEGNANPFGIGFLNFGERGLQRATGAVHFGLNAQDCIGLEQMRIFSFCHLWVNDDDVRPVAGEISARELERILRAEHDV